MRHFRRSVSRAALGLGAALLAAFSFTSLTAVPAAAGPIGLRAAGGWYTESDEFHLNAGAQFGAGTIAIIPNVDWLFVDSGSVYSLNLDATLTVIPMAVANVYAGGGLGLLTSDPENGDSDTQTVVNLIAGAGLNAVPLKPFAQFKWVVADGDDPLAFSIGVRF